MDEYQRNVDLFGGVEEVWTDTLGRLHRDDGPAYVYSNKRGVMLKEEYWHHGARHRQGGPAIIRRDLSGEVVDLVGYEFGKCVS